MNKTLDLCGDRYGPSIIVANEQILQKYIELHNRGVRQRHIIEIITLENITDCKKLMKFQELRHLDGLKGYLSILDGKLLGSHVYGQERQLLPHVVESTVRIFVEQQQYFFEALWRKAIPAKQRFKEIEQGAKENLLKLLETHLKYKNSALTLLKRQKRKYCTLFYSKCVPPSRESRSI